MNKVIIGGPDAEELADMLQAQLAGKVDCFVTYASSADVLTGDGVWIIINDEVES